jgi:hypothetical protein
MSGQWPTASKSPKALILIAQFAADPLGLVPVGASTKSPPATMAITAPFESNTGLPLVPGAMPSPTST